MDGFQDTLYTHADRQYYRNCVISGIVDFIFGDVAAMIQSSLIIVRKPMDNQFNTITAQGKADKNENTWIVIQNCCIVPDLALAAVGDAAAMIQSSLIIVCKSMDNQFNAITAQGKVDKNENTGIVIQNCCIVPDQTLAVVRFKLKTYFGRPWKLFVMTVYLENQIGDLIQLQGWKEWEGSKHLDTLFYVEFGNRSRWWDGEDGGIVGF